MSFQQFSFHPQVLAGVESVGYTQPTPIQQQAIPVAMEGRDIMGLAQTGTGKTAAFALPILHRLASTPPKKGVRCLVLAPTRELAEQIHQSFVDLGQHLRIKSIAIYGGVAKGPQLAGLRRGAQVVIACPGRLLDHVDQKDIDLSGVEILVLDEADTMCDMGFLPDVRRILARVPEKRQTLFFSATMPDEIRSLAVKILKDPELVQIGAIAPAKTVSHALYPVPDKLKKNLLLALLEQTATGRVLIFTRTKHRARSLALELDKKSFRVAALQGNMSQSARQRSMDGFRAGKFDIMVATDIAAHGIDVPEISHVINFDFPNTTDTYTHRIGRTGRADQTGEAFTLACAEDSSMVREVEKELGLKIERRRLPGFDYGDFTPEEQFPEALGGHRRAAGSKNGNGGGQRQNSGTRRPTGGQSKYRGNGSSNNGRGEGKSTDRMPGNGASDGRRTEQPAVSTSRNGISDGRRTERPAVSTSRNGISDGPRSERSSERTPQTDPSNGRRAQPAASTSRNGISDGPRSERSSERTPRTDPSNGRRAQSAASTSRNGISDGPRSERSSEGRPRTNSSNVRRTGPLLGRMPRSDSSDGRRQGQLLGKTLRSGSSDGRTPGQLLGKTTRTNSSSGIVRSQKLGGPSPRPAQPGKPRRRSPVRG